MKLRQIVFVAAALSSPLAFADTPAGAKQPPPSTAPATGLGPGATAVKQANDNIVDLLKKKAPPADVTKSVRNFLDLDELGKAAMSNQWSKLDPKQQKEFLDTLRALVEDNYVRGMKSNVTYTTKYTGEKKLANGDILVNTEVSAQRNGRPITIKIDYQVKNIGGQLKAVDVFTDDVGLVDNYRSMFDKIMGKGGYADLIKKMKDKLEAQQKATNAG